MLTDADGVFLMSQWLPPHQTGEFKYPAGNKTIQVYETADDNPAIVEKYDQTFEMGDCYIFHDGRTGRAVLNSPADGDIKFIN
jgi:hypothetical protein